VLQCCSVAVLQCVLQYGSETYGIRYVHVLQLCCSVAVLQCVLQCGAEINCVCYVHVLQLCCSVLQCVAVCSSVCCDVLQRSTAFAVCLSYLALCYSVLQRVLQRVLYCVAEIDCIRYVHVPQLLLQPVAMCVAVRVAACVAAYVAACVAVYCRD